MAYEAKATISIHAPLETVWHALTTPEEVKKYFFDTNLVTDWEVGSPIYFRGEWEGKEYEDKGVVLSYDEPYTLSYSYISSWSPESSPEQTITYDLKEVEGLVEVTILQQNVESEEKAKHSSDNWKMVLSNLKDLLEGGE